MDDLSIIIVSFNVKELIAKCVESVYHNTKNLKFEVIIIDNDSTDGTSEEVLKLKSQFPNLKFIQNKENQGFSKANNVGIKESKGKYVLFLNPDTLVHKGTLEGMVAFMDKNEDAGAATCKVLMTSGKIDDASHRGFPTPWNSFVHFSGLSQILGNTKLFGGYGLKYKDLSVVHEIDALAGAFMMVRRKAGDQANWWDEDYFFYGEDLDFCYMLKQKGWKIYYVPDYTILHYKGVSGGLKRISKDLTTANEETRIRAAKARFDAMRIFYKKHYEKKYPRLVTKLVYLGISLKQFIS